MGRHNTRGLKGWVYRTGKGGVYPAGVCEGRNVGKRMTVRPNAVEGVSHNTATRQALIFRPRQERSGMSGDDRPDNQLVRWGLGGGGGRVRRVRAGDRQRV